MRKRGHTPAWRWRSHLHFRERLELSVVDVSKAVRIGHVCSAAIAKLDTVLTPVVQLRAPTVDVVAAAETMTLNVWSAIGELGHALLAHDGNTFGSVVRVWKGGGGRRAEEERLRAYRSGAERRMVGEGSACCNISPNSL